MLHFSRCLYSKYKSHDGQNPDQHSLRKIKHQSISQHNIAALFFIVFNRYLRVVTGDEAPELTLAHYSETLKEKKRVPRFSFLSIGDRMKIPQLLNATAENDLQNQYRGPPPLHKLHTHCCRSAVLVETLVNAQPQTFISMSYA